MPVDGVGSGKPSWPPERVDLTPFSSPSEGERHRAVREVVERQLSVVERLKDAEGNGQESAGKGDPDVTDRRRALTPLMAPGARYYVAPDRYRRLGPNVVADDEWLTKAERTEYATDHLITQFEWAQSNMSNRHQLKRHFETQKKTQDEMAARISAGEPDSFFRDDNGSVIGLLAINDRTLRTQAMIDLWLQFRAARSQSGTPDDQRNDKVGPVLVAEQIMLLRELGLDVDTTEGRKHAAMLRNIVASHPQNDINSIFIARNAVADLLRDGDETLSYGEIQKDDHAMAWVFHEVPPGANASVYKSIHHNFSRNTPANIESAISEWVFPVGPKAMRVPTFASLVEALELLRSGRQPEAELILSELQQQNPEALNGFALPGSVDAGADAAATALARFLADKSTRHLGEHPEQNLRYLYRIYEAVCLNQPSTERLSRLMFESVEALPNVADVLVARAQQRADALVESLGLEHLYAPKGIDPATRAYAFPRMAAALWHARNRNFGYAYTLLEEVKTRVADRSDPNVTYDGPAQQTLRTALNKLSGTFEHALADAIAAHLKEYASSAFDVSDESAYFAAAWLFQTNRGDDVRPALAGLGLDRGAAETAIAPWLKRARQLTELKLLRELGEARLAVRDELLNATGGVPRQKLLVLDAELDRMLSEELGDAVDRLDGLHTPLDVTECLVAMRAGLRGAIASGLDALRASPEEDPGAKNPGFASLVARLDTTLKRTTIDAEAFRKLLIDIRVATEIAIENIRAMVWDRERLLRSQGVDLDPEFSEQFIKETPLHYLIALAEKGLRFGLKEEVSADRIANIDGIRILNNVGEVVFRDVVVAEDMDALKALRPSKDAFATVYGFNEKSIIAIGGLGLDTEDAPGGNSHVAVYARNNGMSVVALPELRDGYASFFAKAQLPLADGGGGIYINDKDYAFEMTTVAWAIENGRIRPDQVESLRPGLNRNIAYLRATANGDDFEVIAKHSAIISPERRTREIELYVPLDEVNGVGRSTMRFDELWEVGLAGRHLAGEKGLVLAALRSHPELGKSVPDGSVITTGRVKDLLAKAHTGKRGVKLLDLWNRPWREDPKVQEVTDDNFLESAFYTDADYRDAVRQELKAETERCLSKYLIKTAPDGSKTLTRAGEKLYQELMANPNLAASESWITRSSFIGEDRPGKSGAGQYESEPNLRDPVTRIEGVITVISSTFGAAPIENNVADEINLRYIMPAVVVQDCLKADFSGVVISRNLETGASQQASYQMVRFFGGGVEGGKTEAGVMRPGSVQIDTYHPDDPDQTGLLSEEDMEKLRVITSQVEEFFDETIEPGQGHAVDMEVVHQDGEWKLVQARVILLDR